LVSNALACSSSRLAQSLTSTCQAIGGLGDQAGGPMGIRGRGGRDKDKTAGDIVQVTAQSRQRLLTAPTVL
jgi:hypothetical protein